MELTQLRYFVMVAENGSTSKAATEAMVSQSTISKSLLRLEGELKIPLFNRDGNRLYLNPAGETFLQQVRPVLAAVERLPQSVKNSHPYHKTYRICVSTAQPVMGRFVHDFLQRNHDAQVLLTDDLWINDCDISIAATPSGRQEDCYLLLTEKILLAVPKGLVPEDKIELELTDLAKIPLILPSEGTALRTLIDKQLQSLPVSLGIRTAAKEAQTIQDLVMSGDGAAFWPERTWPKPDTAHVTLYDVAGIELRQNIYAILPPKRLSQKDCLLDSIICFFDRLKTANEKCSVDD